MTKKAENRVATIKKANEQLTRFDLRSIDSFAELKRRSKINLDLEKCKNMTAYVDALLLNAHTYFEIVKEVEHARKVKFHDNNDFKTEKRIMSHIRHRIRHNKIKVVKNKRTNRVHYVAFDA